MRREQGAHSIKRAMFTVAVVAGLVLNLQPSVGAAPNSQSAGSNGSIPLFLTWSGLYAKERLDGPWIKIADSASAAKAVGNNIVYTTGDGVWAKDGVTGIRYKLTDGQEVVFSEKMFVTRFGYEIYAKTSITAKWTDLGHASYWQPAISGDRITYLAGNANDIWAKDGINGVWHKITSYATGTSISGQIALINDYDTLYGKTSLNSNWVKLNPTPVKYLGLTEEQMIRAGGSRIAYTDTNDHVWVKDGLYGTWYDEYVNGDSFQLSDSMLVMRLGSNLYGKTALDSNWVALNPTPVAVSVPYGQPSGYNVDGNRLTYYSADGHYWAKDGLLGTWYQLY